MYKIENNSVLTYLSDEENIKVLRRVHPKFIKRCLLFEDYKYFCNRYEHKARTKFYSEVERTGTVILKKYNGLDMYYFKDKNPLSNKNST